MVFTKQNSGRNTETMSIKSVAKILLSVVLCGAFTIPAFAQFNPSNRIDVQASPETPGPFEQVALELSGYGIDIDRLHTSWYVNDKLELAGIGKKNSLSPPKGWGLPPLSACSFVQGPRESLPKRSYFHRQRLTCSGRRLAPYTPAFYRGKALATPEATIAVIAIPNMTAAGGKRVRDKRCRI